MLVLILVEQAQSKLYRVAIYSLHKPYGLRSGYNHILSHFGKFHDMLKR